MRTMPATRFLQSSPSSEPSLLSNPFYIGVVLFFAVITFLSVIALVLALSWRCLRGKVTDLINKAAIKSLPILPFSDVAKQKNNNTGCVICLAEFKKGERVRVLPQCDHAFHVGCIDKWLVSHLTCPTCRETVVVPRCI